MTLHLIAEDLEEHAWYEEVVGRTIAAVESLAARWAAFEDYASARGTVATDAEEPR